jgi:HlyD family secretion protein
VAVAGLVLILVVVAASVHRALSVPAVSVKTAVVEQRLLADDALVSATVEAGRQEQLVAPFAARLIRYDLREGDSFTAGEVLAELDTTDAEKQAREAEAALQVAEAQRDQAYNPGTAADLAQAEANQAACRAAYESATDTLKRDLVLFQSGAVSQATVDQDQAAQALDLYNLKTAEAGVLDLESPDPHKLAVSDSQVEQARVAAQDAANTVAEGRLTAPFAGVVLQELPQEGDFLPLDALVLLVARAGSLQVEADLSEQDIGGIAVGQSADVQWAGQPGRTWQATVIRIAPAVIKNTALNENVVRVYLGFARDPDGLIPGASVDVTIHRIVAHQALMVPNEALLGSGATRTLFVVIGNRAHRRTIGIGHANELYTEVLTGVNKGELVILDPGNIQDGQTVKNSGGVQL